MKRNHYKARPNLGMWLIVGLVLIATLAFTAMLSLQIL